jgi:hypothetical protein
LNIYNGREKILGKLAIIAADSNDEIVFQNKAARSLFKKDLKGYKAYDLIPAEEREKYSDTILGIADDTTAARFVFSFKLASKTQPMLFERINIFDSEYRVFTALRGQILTQKEKEEHDRKNKESLQELLDNIAISKSDTEYGSLDGDDSFDEIMGIHTETSLLFKNSLQNKKFIASMSILLSNWYEIIASRIDNGKTINIDGHEDQTTNDFTLISPGHFYIMLSSVISALFDISGKKTANINIITNPSESCLYFSAELDSDIITRECNIKTLVGEFKSAAILLNAAQLAAEASGGVLSVESCDTKTLTLSFKIKLMSGGFAFKTHEAQTMTAIIINSSLNLF